MKKIKCILLNDKNFNSIVAFETNKTIGVDHLSVKQSQYGIIVKYFTGGTHGSWVEKFYPWHMIRGILY